MSFFSERFGRWISLAGELPTPHHTPTETPLLEDFDGHLYFSLVYHKVSTALKEPQSLYQDAWRAFIGYESPSLKRKYSEIVDLVEDDAEEPDPNDVSAEEVSTLARVSEVETGHQTETKKDYEGVSLSLRNIVQLPLVLFHYPLHSFANTPPHSY